MSECSAFFVARQQPCDKQRRQAKKMLNVHSTMLPLASGKEGLNFSILGRKFVSEAKTVPATYTRDAKENGVSRGDPALHLLTSVIDIY